MKRDDEPIFITKEQALEALPDREIIHSFAGFIGADWNRESVVEEIEAADKIAWVPNIFDHELATQVGDRVRRFDVQSKDTK